MRLWWIEKAEPVEKVKVEHPVDIQEVDIRVLTVKGELLTQTVQGYTPSDDESLRVSAFWKANDVARQDIYTWKRNGVVYLEGIKTYIPWEHVQLITVSEPREHLAKLIW